MNRMKRNLLFALLGGIVATAIYASLLFTRTLHGFAVKALGPAIEFHLFHLGPDCHTPWRCLAEDFSLNIALYTFWIFIVLTGIDLLRRLKRKLVG